MLSSIQIRVDLSNLILKSQLLSLLLQLTLSLPKRALLANLLLDGCHSLLYALSLVVGKEEVLGLVIW